jgi:hypothetical protein
MAIVRYYVAENNPDGAYVDGVPLRDITDEDWQALPERLQRSADATGFYRKTPIPRAREQAPAKEE